MKVNTRSLGEEAEATGEKRRRTIVFPFHGRWLKSEGEERLSSRLSCLEITLEGANSLLPGVADCVSIAFGRACRLEASGQICCVFSQYILCVV
ncbi:hypothetical protein A0J61_05796 [Choanephora cucurbitarum]|uniref:Uncharacterized protein n=1 Tax=Choanephora cucurbitarum TaxID=101091 RepID=A0A1C7NFN4_9FUNG|nr:hypothetical protein A0J61_05796 [Choanephora cucurbitarum]